MKWLVLAAAVVFALASPALARAAPRLDRPNPTLSSVSNDYINPPREPDGRVAVLRPLRQAVTNAALYDQARLAFEREDDLGGFTSAPIGRLTLTSGGRTIVGTGKGTAQIPLFSKQAGGKVNSFTFTQGTSNAAPDNGKQPVKNLPGPPVPVPPATSNNKVPPPNQGFGGAPGSGSGRGSSRGKGGGSSTGTTVGGPGGTGGRTTSGRTTTSRTTTTRPKPPTTTATTTAAVSTSTAGTTTTTATTTTTSGGGGGGGGGAGDCGVNGLSITSDHSTCHLDFINAKPGDETHEVMTIKNTSDSSYTLSLQVSGTSNPLWQDLAMGVWEAGHAPPDPLPPLSFWIGQYSDLATLKPGASISLVIELQLPTTAGNGDQGLAAILDFNWRAQA
jgi:hypothetical protein